jgi:hypothetical protein
VNAATRTAAFGAGVAVAFGVAFGVGHAADLGIPRADAGVTGTSGSHGAAHGAGGTPDAHTGHEDAAGAGVGGAGAAADALPGGLQVAQGGYRLVLDHTSTTASRRTPLSFRVIGPDDQPVRSYTRTHDKDLHLIVVRRDLTGFQHVHPRLDAEGSWRTDVDLTPGSWRVLADFDPAGDGAPMTLGADLHVAGSFVPQPVPEPRSTTTVDGYAVTLRGSLSPGADSRLTLTVSRDGRPVTDLQPYLAAYGHLVALRQGDLAYLHVHPDGEPGDGRTEAGPDIVFHTTAPSTGTYRLFLDFKHDDTVRTAEFTVTAGKEAPGHGH